MEMFVSDEWRSVLQGKNILSVCLGFPSIAGRCGSLLHLSIYCSGSG